MVEAKKIKISGIAVREGLSRNGRKYIAKELAKFAPTLIGRPILKDHESLTDNTIGKVTHAEAIEKGSIVTYEGWIKEDGSGIIERIKDGRISEVSIGAMSKRMVKEKEDDNFVIPVDMESLELSTTPTPGVRGTSVNVGAEENIEFDLSEESIKNIINNYELESLNYTNKDLEKNNDKAQTVKEDEELEVIETGMKLTCSSCGGKFMVYEKTYTCPYCGAKVTKSQSQSLELNDKNINEKEEDMEAKNNATNESATELEALKKELESYKVKVKEAEEAEKEAEDKKEEAEKEAESLRVSLKKEAISKYEEKAKAKGLTPKNLSNESMDKIQFAIEMVDEMPEPTAEEPEKEEDAEEEDKKEESEEPKEKAKTQTKEAKTADTSVDESFNDYVVTQEDVHRGFAFYKHY